MNTRNHLSRDQWLLGRKRLNWLRIIFYLCYRIRSLMVTVLTIVNRKSVKVLQNVKKLLESYYICITFILPILKKIRNVTTLKICIWIKHTENKTPEIIWTSLHLFHVSIYPCAYFPRCNMLMEQVICALPLHDFSLH